MLDAVAVDRGSFSCTLGGYDGQPPDIVATATTTRGSSDGVVLTQRVDVRHAGRP